jgi:hypothetical protein
MLASSALLILSAASAVPLFLIVGSPAFAAAARAEAPYPTRPEAVPVAQP